MYSLPPHLTPTLQNSTPLLSSFSSLPPDTHHLLYLGHRTTSNKSTTIIAIVTRCRGGSCHGVSPGSTHPSKTTGCGHCCVTELLRLKRGGSRVTLSGNEGQRQLTALVSTHKLATLTTSPHPLSLPLFYVSSSRLPNPSLRLFSPSPFSFCPSTQSFPIDPLLEPA